MLSAHERLDAGHSTRGDLGLGLIVENELAALQREAHVARELEAVGVGVVATGLVALLARAGGLARYMATSAWRSRVSRLSPWSGAMASPMLAWT